MSTQDTTLPPLPEPAYKRVCLKYAGGDTPSLYKEGWVIVELDAFSEDQMRAAIAAQAPQPSPLIAVGEDGEGQENHCPECGAEPGQMCSDEEGTEHGRKVHAVRQAQQAQGVPQDARKLLHIAQLAAAPQAEPQTPAPAQPSIQDLAAGAHYPQVTGWTNPAPHAEPQPEREPTTWSRYVAGMIACYLKWPDDDERTEAVAGIIERRRWTEPKWETMNPDQYASLQWLERLCEPALYLDRLGPIRDYLQAHGIGTKGGGTK